MTEQANPQQSAPPRNQCRHVHLEGRRCGSPCLRGENFCYYHHISRRRPKHLGQPPLDAVFTMLPIDDAPSIQLALADILARICTRSLDNKRASLVLYGLSIASLNLKRGQHRPELNPKPSEVNAVIEDLEFDPDLGPLAPVALMDIPNDEARKSLMRKFVEYCERPPNACKRCAERAIVDANKAEGRRLMAELNRRRSLGLPEYDPPLDPNTPYPNDALCAAETARIAADLATPSQTAPSSDVGTIKNGVILSGARSAESKDPDESNTTPTANTVPPTTARTSFAEANDPPPHAEAPSEPALPNPDQETWAKFAAHLPNLKASAEEATEPGAPSSTQHHRGRPGWSVGYDPERSRRVGRTRSGAPFAPLTTQNSQLTTSLILPTLYAVAEEPAKKRCRTPTRTRRPTATPDPIATTIPDLTLRTTRLTRTFRHRYHPNEPPTPLQKAKS